MPDDPAVEADQWRKLAAALRARWQAETDANHRNQLGQTLGRILADRLTTEEHLDFLRVQLASGPTDHAATYARQLFDALLAQPWQQEHEDEALALLDRLAEAEHPADAAERLSRQVAYLYRLTDAMLEARFNSAVATIGEPQNLSRTELREQRRASFRQAADGLAARLRKEMDAREGPFVQWLNIERIYLEVQRADSAVPVAGDPEQAKQRAETFLRLADDCWEILGPSPPRLDTADASDVTEQLETALKTRCLATLANLAARRSADAALIERLLEYLDRGIAAEPQAEAWKRLKYQLLVALDRPGELEAALLDWIRPEEAVNHWRLVLGYLLAEQGKIPPAIAQFEAIRADDELGPAEYRALAGWYLAADRREQHERALIDVYMTAEEWELRSLLSRHLSPWQRFDGALPAELSAEVLRIFAVLFDKSGSPQNHLRQVREFYRATRDFRLLSGMADAVIGHTSGKIYPFLQGMDTVLSEVRDEATVDTIVEHLAAVRRRATTDVDRRALDLLETMIERRAAELQNQPGPHGERALAALQRAMQHAWTPGEPRLVADLLAGLGTIAYPPLAAEQIRQLQRLHRGAQHGSADRLHVAHGLGRIYWGYDRRNDALALLDAALAEYERANDGVLPALANDALGTLIGYLEQQGHYAAGESRLQQQLESPATLQQSYWLTQRLYQLYENAIRNGAALSLGAGQTLYQNVERTVRGDLETGDHNHRYQLISRLCGIYRAASAKKLSGVEDDLKDFAFEQLPRLLPRQTTHYQSIVSTMSDTLRHVVDVRTGLAFLVERIEQEPAWFRLNNQDGWNRFGGTIAHWRTQVKDLGELEPRLLTIVLAELRRDLETGRSRSRTIYHRHHGYFWSEKTDDFANTADGVADDRKDSGATVAYVAEYLYRGLDRHERAIEVMLSAHQRGVLDESGTARLIEYLQWQDRHAESIPILLPLVETRPENLDYRVKLMRAYFRTQQPEKLRDTWQAAHEFFHAGDRWTEAAMVQLGWGCLETQLYEPSVGYFREAIAHHQRTRPDRGIGGGTLSHYYEGLAQAYSGLGKIAEAVDAACGAIVSWGPRHDQRAQALDNLKWVLRQQWDHFAPFDPFGAPSEVETGRQFRTDELDAFAIKLDRQAEQTGQENPIVRKALGQIYMESEQFAKAIAQLEIATAVQPNDRQTLEALVECYDRQQDAAGAIDRIFRLLELAPREIALYKQLGQRLSERGDAVQAERAYTSIVEALPEEAESHLMLAEVRQTQDRWAEAVPHWRRAAELRALEPQGLLGLAAALIHLQRRDEAAEALRQLDAQSWPTRFGDIRRQTRPLWQQLDQPRPKADR